MGASFFHHALRILEDVCIGCTHCMKVCPTEAIRVRDGKARLFDDRCIDCGECFRACPVRAIIVEQDDFSRIFGYKYRVALVPSILIGQFARNIPVRTIYSALLEEGFTHVYEAEHGADVLKEVLKDYTADSEKEKPVISSFCPAVVRLIQVKFPSLVDHVALLKPPLDVAALSIRRDLILNEKADTEEIGIFYVTPCAAKIAAIKSPVGEDFSAITGVINMNYIYNKVFAWIKKESIESCKVPEKEPITDEEMIWALTNGEAPHASGRSLAIDGISNVTKFLERVENESVGHFDFLELRACDKSCSGGILNVANRFLSSERLRDRAENYREQKKKGYIIEDNKTQKYKKYLVEHINISKVQPRSMMKLDDDMEVAMRKMERVRSLMCYLPGIDCGSCGSPSCKSLAEDVVQRRADISDCIFIQKSMQKNNKLDPEHGFRMVEKIWGKGKFDKDCYKKGAKNEGLGNS